MNRVLEGVKPERLWYHFENIAQIPRCSKHEEAIREYIINFAKEKGLEYRVDSIGNVVVIKPADSGYENKPTVILQGHIDMVCEKNKDTEHDFSKDPIKLKVEGDWLTADGTTLGADNGIGVAAALAILEDKDFKTGRIEALFTIDEETGLTGAFNLDPSNLTGKILINLDSEEEGAIYIGCAGGRDTKFTMFVSEEAPTFEETGLEVKLTGLKGGHSGLNIHEGRGNAIKMAARILFELKKSVSYKIASFDAGDKHNAIPRECVFKIALNKNAVGLAKSIIESMAKKLQNEFKIVEPDFTYEIKDSNLPETTADFASTEEMVNLLMTIPHGVLMMSAAVEGLVETSTNLAVAKLQDDIFEVLASHRSSIASAIDWVGDMHRAIGEIFGTEVEQDEGYPGWTPNPDSEVLKLARESFKKVLGYEPEVKAIHAGLECGIISEKCGGLDAISFGPTIEGAHSPDERVSIKSTQVFWDCLVELLKDINK
ncbi:dipeptidase D [Thermotomaculum hydrothermale]|uniref:Cytosol non-specific dipeptidase n=1 Tax=Thermotomaculum hydrothermale TaxID=981385 RepID=A0A7R6PSD0_9BACT|nr:aminoacyl-histidine dipeptidase [Thermotomaculum hydrothermale]BBB31722.1 dipeptidase D [Thermotomaculum hydrothermale]